MYCPEFIMRSPARLHSKRVRSKVDERVVAKVTAKHITYYKYLK
jgi:hypothetical protein